jgi:RNA polymerase sigma-70 factor (ECF subfamily)
MIPAAVTGRALGRRLAQRPWRESCVEIQDSPLTRASLLIRLRDRSDQPAWNEFVSIYGPVIYGFARRRGLQDADAADTMQDVLRSVTTAIQRLDYDPRQGRFRGWLYTLTRNRVFTLQSSRNGKPRGTGDSNVQSLLAAQPDRSEALEEEWELDYRRSLTATVLEQLREEFSEKIWQAFWQTAVEAQPAAEVARSLGTSPGSVYVAKSRVLARAREAVQRRLDEDQEANS